MWNIKYILLLLLIPIVMADDIESFTVRTGDAQSYTGKYIGDIQLGNYYVTKITPQPPEEEEDDQGRGGIITPETAEIREELRGELIEEEDIPIALITKIRERRMFFIYFTTTVFLTLFIIGKRRKKRKEEKEWEKESSKQQSQELQSQSQQLK